jgi:2TM domain
MIRRRYMTMTEQVIQKEAISMAQGLTLAAYKRAEAELRIEEGRIGFFAHAIIYVLVNILLIVLNLVFVPGYLWFFYPLISWGIGLSMHYLYEVRWMHKTLENWEAKVEYRARQNLLREVGAPGTR